MILSHFRHNNDENLDDIRVDYDSDDDTDHRDDSSFRRVGTSLPRGYSGEALFGMIGF